MYNEYLKNKEAINNNYNYYNTGNFFFQLSICSEKEDCWSKRKV